MHRAGKKYYDHELAYRAKELQGFTGWESPGDEKAYKHFSRFAQSEFFPTPGVALDLGCGGGELCIALSKRTWKTIGIEFSDTALKLARVNALRENVDLLFLRSDVVEPLPLRQGRFDLAIDNHVLHCIVNPEHRRAFLKNVKMSLAPGGRFFSAGMSSEGSLDYETLAIDRDTKINHSNNRIWMSQSQLEREFSEAGFSILDIRRESSSDAPASGDDIILIAE